VETFPAAHDDDADFARTLRSAYHYAKVVTLGATPWPRTNAVMARNRRVGASVSGVAQFVAQRGLGRLHGLLDRGYGEVQAADAAFSDRYGVPRSIKTTCVKPSGTVSLLAGATPGMHYPEARFYTRRVRVASTSPLLATLAAAGHRIEPDVSDPDATSVVEFPVDAGEGVRTAADVPMWEQLSLAAFLQRHWADNQVSCTVTFDPATEAPRLTDALDYFQYQLKGVSFLPRAEAGAYAQMPYEAITEAEYRAAVSKLRPLDFDEYTAGVLHEGKLEQHMEVPDKFCEACAVDEGAGAKP
jgi:ribonucleoside-triphosphate reductase